MNKIHYNQHPQFFLFIKLNGIFSLTCAIAIFITANQLPSWLNLYNTDSYNFLAVCLTLFAARLFWIAKAKTVYKLEAWAIVIGDLAWVAGSAILLITDKQMSQLGFWAVDIVAICVLIFALGQARGLILKPEHC